MSDTKTTECYFYNTQRASLNRPHTRVKSFINYLSVRIFSVPCFLTFVAVQKIDFYSLLIILVCLLSIACLHDIFYQTVLTFQAPKIVTGIYVFTGTSALSW